MGPSESAIPSFHHPPPTLAAGAISVWKSYIELRSALLAFICFIVSEVDAILGDFRLGYAKRLQPAPFSRQLFMFMMDTPTITIALAPSGHWLKPQMP